MHTSLSLPQHTYHQKLRFYVLLLWIFFYVVHDQPECLRGDTTEVHERLGVILCSAGPRHAAECEILREAFNVEKKLMKISNRYLDKFIKFSLYFWNN